MAIDHQTYTQGAEQWMTGQNYEINVDINATYADGTPNPNAGRPYAGNGASQPGLNFIQTTVRDVFRFTPTGELRPSDFLGDTTLAKIIGKQDFTGLYERNQVTKTYLEFAEFAVDPQYMLDNSNNVSGISPPPTGQLQQNRSFEWIVYLGPSLLNKASAHGANLTQYSVRRAAAETADDHELQFPVESAHDSGSPGLCQSVRAVHVYQLIRCSGTAVCQRHAERQSGQLRRLDSRKKSSGCSPAIPTDFPDLVSSDQPHQVH